MEHSRPKARPRADAPLFRACAWAMAAALLAHHLGAAAGALLAAAGVLICLRSGRPGPSLLALPAMLAALPAPQRPLPELPPGPVRIEGIAAGPVRLEPGGERFALVRSGSAVRVLAEGRPGVKPGDRISGIARAGTASLAGGEPPPLVVAEGALRRESGPPSLPALVTALRGDLQDRILRLWPEGRGAFLCTLVLGSGPDLPGDLLAAHRATGLSHLLAVSGAHASMLALLLGVLPGARGEARSRLRRRLGALILLLYGAVTGMQPPMLRALCAFAVMRWAADHGRPLTLGAVLVPPALLSCAVDPGGILGPSFTLSYAAVCGLWLGAGGPRRTWLQRWLFAPLCMSFLASAATAPLTLFWFGQWAPCTVLATPLLAPVVTVLLAGGLLGPVLDMCLPGGAGWLCAPVGWVADLYAAAVGLCDALPGTPVFAPARPSAVLLGAGAVLGIALLALLRGKTGALLLLACLCAPHFLPASRPAAPVLHLFAVGHGQCALLELPSGKNVVIDCGSLTHRALAARKAWAAMRRRVVDLLVLSHGDADHVDGVADLLQRMPVRDALLPEELLATELATRLSAAGARLHALAPGGTFAFGGELQAARPLLEDAASNDHSMWVRLRLEGADALLPGDAGQRGIAAALAQDLAAPADVLVLPHHGRPEPLAGTLLAAVQPRVCLVSNRHGEGLSLQGTLALRHGAEVWATGEHGDIEVHFTDRIALHAPTGNPSRSSTRHRAGN